MSNTDEGSVPNFLKEHQKIEEAEIVKVMPTDKLEALSFSLDRMVTLKEIHDKNKKTNAKVWAEYEKYENNVLALLKESKLPKFEGSTHGVSIQTVTSVKTPKTNEDKELLFKWIEDRKGKEALLSYMSISSQTLNSFYKLEKAEYFEQTGKTDFMLDGVEPPKSTEKLKIAKRRGKK